MFNCWAWMALAIQLACWRVVFTEEKADEHKERPLNKVDSHKLSTASGIASAL